MKLAIFDIDGTLTNTNDVDGECFVQAFAEVHGITDIDTDWSAYPHTTDSGIAVQIFRDRWGRAASESELFELRRGFEALLRAQYRTNPLLFAEIDGAAIVLERLKHETDWAIVIATGCWSESALLKLEAAGIHVDGQIIAHADDSLSREDILRSAESKALAYYRQNGFDKIVSVGDGVWDVRTARNLKFAFLGVGGREREIRLHRAGATHVIEDFTDFDKLVRALNEARIPESEEKM